MSNDEVLDALIELEARSSELLKLNSEQGRPQTWEDLETRLGLDPLPNTLGLRGQDHFVSVFAGFAGGALDLCPKVVDCLTSENMHQMLDKAFKAKLRKVIGGEGMVPIDNAMGGADHRLVGPTHDILRLFKTIQLVRRGEFESAVKGVLKVKDSYRDGLPNYLKVDNTSDALILVLMHWAADFFSARSLPIPGWSKLAEINDHDFVNWLFKMYREGANLRMLVGQFISNLSGCALISIIIHIYRYIDIFFITKNADFLPSRLQLTNDLRFQWMSRNASLVAVGVSAGYAIATHNPFRCNYMAMMKFFANAQSVEKILDAQHLEIDRRTEQLLKEVEIY